ncbi:5-carboxymethyl-2-hydroxymuconate Delta-isomerase [Streptomyces sp. NBC_01267]|uniref:5-carboxymethyl-2-hydroxymuconate Delta-isomerase n=1 Tax=unclassified Streptomyces TaxID=2593676 RepID=UPI002024A23E|nr:MULTISPECIES: 5-carboxymethyl-2-hydroxymuconate Delta-isomerase [unclassified Streptomyces]WSV56803.1 5-carboxymethyl-2-hydroxymuconate Delta-isomerase [Streptomyces sp. NBC_01014]
MPQITVEYSASLDDSFDRRGFALALHPVIVETVQARIAACKTRFVRAEEFVVGGGGTDDAIVHVGIALLAGRTDEAKARLTEAVPGLVRQYLKPADDSGTTVHISAETRDLDASYR